MPWTFAHPAAVLPLRRLGAGRLSLAALVVGSIAPDFVYHVGPAGLGRWTHSAAGILLFCLPAGLLCLAMLRALRQPLIGLLPRPHRQALMSHYRVTARPDLRRVAWLGLAVVLGACTHVAWDSFTHATGLAVRHLAVLRWPVVEIGGRLLPAYSLLQHLSTLVGVTALAAAYIGWLRAQPAPPAGTPEGSDSARWRILGACLAASVAVAVVLAMPGVGDAARPVSGVVVRAVIHATDGFAVSFIVAALLWSRRPAENPRNRGCRP